MKRLWLIPIFFAFTLACRSSNQAARVKTGINKQENTQIIRRTQPVFTHVEDSVGQLNVEKVKAVNSEFIESVEPEIAITEGPQAQITEEAESKETFDELKTDLAEDSQQEANTRSQFIVFAGPESELELVKESGPFIMDIAQDAPQQIAKGPKTVISTIREIVGISNAQESNQFGKSFVEVSGTKPRETIDEPKTDIVKEPQKEDLMNPETIVTEESKPATPGPNKR